MRRYVMPLMTVALASAALAPLTAGAANNPSAHQHGHAELQVAIDGNTADVFVRSPAYNLLGFEHEPRTEQQHQQLADLEPWLIQPLYTSDPAPPPPTPPPPRTPPPHPPKRVEKAAQTFDN